MDVSRIPMFSEYKSKRDFSSNLYTRNRQFCILLSRSMTIRYITANYLAYKLCFSIYLLVRVLCNTHTVGSQSEQRRNIWKRFRREFGKFRSNRKYVEATLNGDFLRQFTNRSDNALRVWALYMNISASIPDDPRHSDIDNAFSYTRKCMCRSKPRQNYET